MVDGSRWKSVLKHNLCRSTKKVLRLKPWSQDGWPSFWLVLYLITFVDIQIVANILSLTHALQYFLIIAQLTFLHQNKALLVYTFFVQDFHEPWICKHIFHISYRYHITIFHHISSFGFLILFFVFITTCFTSSFLYLKW